MNIDKKEMEYAFYHRDEKKYENELIGYFQEMASYFANKLTISYKIRDDYIQEAVLRGYQALEKYNPNKKNSVGQTSSPFSYFYKVIYIHFRYLLRRDRQKAQRRPHESSFDELAPMLEDSHSTEQMAEMYTEDDKIVVVDGNTYKREDVIHYVKKAKKYFNAWKKSGFSNLMGEPEIVINTFHSLKEKHTNSL